MTDTVGKAEVEQTPQDYKPSIQAEEQRTLPSGEKEFFFDVTTSDLEVNMGPQHPATHGVMRVLIRCDGELVTGAQAHLGLPAPVRREDR